jgi:transposase-like protein
LVEISLLIKEAQEAGARQSKACEIVGISEKTLQRWNQEDNEQDGRLDAKHTFYRLYFKSFGIFWTHFSFL